MESGAKYIFGEFSHEEVQQYFQNSHISVELPPCSEDTDDDDATGHTGGDCSEPARGLASSNGGDNSVEGSPPDEAGGPSTLNPRAPEFCLPLDQPATSFPRQPAPPPFPPAPMIACRTDAAAAAAVAAPLTGDPAPPPPPPPNGSVHAAAPSMGPAAPLTFGHPVPTAALRLPLFVPSQAALAGAEAAPVVVPRPLVPVHALPVGLAPTATAFFGSAHTAPVVLLQPLPAFNNGDEMSAGEAGADGNGDGSSRSSGGPRERRNKKKRPPGYYGYQDGTGAMNGMSCADDGDEASPDAPFAPPPPQGAAPPHQGQLSSSPLPPSQDLQPQRRQPPEASVPVPRPAEPTEQPAPLCKRPVPVVPPAAALPPVPSAPPAPPQSAAQPTELPGIGGPQGQPPPPVVMMMLMNGPQGLPVEALLVNQLGMAAVPGVPVVPSTAPMTAPLTVPMTVPMTVPLLVLPQRTPPVVMSVAPQAAVQLVAPVPQAPAAQPQQPTLCLQQKPQQPQPKQQPQPTPQQQQPQQVGNSTSSSSSSLIMLATRGAHQLPVSAIRTGGSFKFGGDTNFADVSGRQRESPPVVFTNARTVPRAALLRDGAALAPMAPPVGDRRSSSAPGDATAKLPRPMATIAPISFGPAMPALSEVVTLPPAAADRQQRASGAAGNAPAPARPREEQVVPVAAVAPNAPRCGEARKGSAQLNGVETAPARPGANTNAAPAGGTAATVGGGGRPAVSVPAAASLDPRPHTPTLAHGGSSCLTEASAVGRDAPAAVAPAKDAQASAVGREAPAAPAGRPAPAAAVTAAGREPSAGADSREAPAVAAAAAAVVAGKSTAAGDAAAHDARPQPPALPGVKTWASLFSASKPAAPSPGPGAAVRVDQPAGDYKAAAGGERSPGSQEAPVPQTAPSHKAGPVSVAEDACAARIAELLSLTPLSYKPVSVQPRGLINRGNWCYINSTLQVLVACAPLYHLLRALPLYGDGERPASATPMLDAFVRLMKEYGSMLPPSKPKTAGPPEKSKDLRVGSPFEPAFIYKLLSIVKSSLCDKGRQEDAEEFLGFVINGLHDEMLSLRRLDSADGAATNGVASDGASSDGCPEGDAEAGGPRGAHGNGRGLQLEDSDGHGQRANNEKGGEEEEEEWEQVGPRNRSAITRSAEFVRSPITDIFGGCIRSAVYQAGVKESATLQPFFTLPLDVSAERVWTLRDALEGLVAREAVQGYTTKNRQEVEVCRRITLEELPPVLVLHLKRFVYDKTGGSQKLLKAIDYPLELEISKDLLSPIAKVKLSKGQRSYRLFAVTCHHGGTATGGHYTTDVQHAGLGLWLHYDDQGVRPTALSAVLKPMLPRTAYLLYYRRTDVQ